jgi:hypothetical protein
MPTQNLVSFVAYWHAFDITWPKQKLTKGFTSYKGAHVTIEHKAAAKVLRFKAFGFYIGYDLIYQLKSNPEGFTIFVRVTPIVFGASNNPIVTFHGTQSHQ